MRLHALLCNKNCLCFSLFAIMFYENYPMQKLSQILNNYFHFSFSPLKIYNNFIQKVSLTWSLKAFPTIFKELFTNKNFADWSIIIFYTLFMWYILREFREKHRNLQKVITNSSILFSFFLHFIFYFYYSRIQCFMLLIVRAHGLVTVRFSRLMFLKIIIMKLSYSKCFADFKIVKYCIW